MVNRCENKNLIIKFAELTNDYFFCDVTLDEVKEAFLEAISNDEKIVSSFINKLNNIKDKLTKDLLFFTKNDPACDGEEEVITCYPGFKAIVYHRIAHELFRLGMPLKARIISEYAHMETGIDIHPGATIGSPFFIDHGTGIVIGETSIIGNNVKIYQGVTLGALSLKDGYKIKGVKRHPTIGNNVTIYANASILGGNVVIGDNVVIGGNVFLTESIPSNHKVIIQKPDLILIKK